MRYISKTIDRQKWTKLSPSLQFIDNGPDYINPGLGETFGTIYWDRDPKQFWKDFSPFIFNQIFIFYQL